jgi:hypothetical protein
VTKEVSNQTNVRNCKDAHCPCSIHCAIARAHGDERDCKTIRRERVFMETILLLIATLSLLYYCYLKGK